MSSLILALNPSIDAEWRVEDVLWEEKNNVHSERRWAGGKGINVARWLKHLGANPLLLLPLGGKTGNELGGYLRAEKIRARIIRVRESTRVNVIVTTGTGRQMRFNPLGPKLSRVEWSSVLKCVGQKLEQMDDARGALLVLSGSLPRGVPVNAYAQFIRLAHQHGIRTLLDCDGEVFAAAVKARPFLVKPNEHELGKWWGKAVRGEKEIVKAADELSRQTNGWVLVSRGPKRGLLLNRAKQCRYFAAPPKVKPRNTVGAGDALLAGVAREIQKGGSPEEWLRLGLQIGSQATCFGAGQLP